MRSNSCTIIALLLLPLAVKGAAGADEDRAYSEAMVELFSWSDDRLRAASKQLEIVANAQTKNAMLASLVEDGLYLWDVTGNRNVVILSGDGAGAFAPSCSATLISGSKLVTAAHCFCPNPNLGGHFGTHDQCVNEALHKKVAYRSFSPVFGFSPILDKPDIHPEYDVDFESWDADRAIADLSIASLAETYPIGLIKIWNGDVLPERIASVASGSISFYKDALRGLFKNDHKYSNGLTTVGITTSPNSPQDDICNRYVFGGDKIVSQLDTFCRRYDASGHDSAYPADVIGCKGDSGGGVYAIDASGDKHLAGVVSNVQVGRRSDPECAVGQSGTTWFVDLRKHTEWIESMVASSEIANQANIVCREVMIPGGAPFVVGGDAMTVGIAAVKDTKDNDHSVSEILSVGSRPGGKCETGNTKMLGYCELSQSDFAFVEAGGAGAKLTICKPNVEE